MADFLGISKSAPRSIEQSKRLFSNDKIKNLTKLKLQEYIESFFNKLGENYDLLQAISPHFVNYNIDRSFDPVTDPTQKKMQIARYFSELRSIIPAILIIDGGVNPVLHNIGLIDSARLDDGYWRGYYPILRRIPVSIIAAARDLDEADEISGVLSLMFNELRNLAGGSYITGKQEEGETWVITLPHEGVSIGKLSEMDIEGEPVEKIWWAEMEMEMLFEDSLAIKQKLPDTPVMPKSATNIPPIPKIIVPDQISINHRTSIVITGFQDRYKIYLSNPKVATLSYNMILTPRGYGKTKIQIYDTAPGRKIIAEKEIEII